MCVLPSVPVPLTPPPSPAIDQLAEAAAQCMNRSTLLLTEVITLARNVCSDGGEFDRVLQLRRERIARGQVSSTAGRQALMISALSMARHAGDIIGQIEQLIGRAEDAPGATANRSAPASLWHAAHMLAGFEAQLAPSIGSQYAMAGTVLRSKLRYMRVLASENVRIAEQAVLAIRAVQRSSLDFVAASTAG